MMYNMLKNSSVTATARADADATIYVDVVSTPAFQAPTNSHAGYPIWALVLGTALMTTLILIVILLAIYYSRKAKKKATEKHVSQFSPIPVIPKDIVKIQLTTSCESSVESMEAPTKKTKKLRPSLSMDTDVPFRMKKQILQPQTTIPKWNYLTSPRPSIGSLQPDLYRSSDSDDGTPPPSEVGRLWFSLAYNEIDSELVVTLIRAKYLPGRGFCKGVRDPFVKIYLLPDEESFQQSRVRKRTLSPKFNETFKFKISQEEVKNRCLRFTVYDVDKRKVRHCLGHAVITLAKMDLTSQVVCWKDLEKSPQVRKEGEIQLSLMCNPYNNKLKVTVCKVQNVHGLESGEAMVYVKVQLFHGHKLVKCKKTSSQSAVGPNKSELIFHESLSFAVPARFYDSCYLQMVTCVAGGTMMRDVALGKVTIGPFLFARGEQLLHWQEMIANSRSVISRWHRLEPSSYQEDTS